MSSMDWLPIIVPQSKRQAHPTIVWSLSDDENKSMTIWFGDHRTEDYVGGKELG